MLVGTDEPQTTTAPELLIEEARQRQRQRAKRRTAVLVAVGVLAVLGFGIYQVARSGGGAQAAKPRAAAVAADPTPTVLYRKIETVKIVPHLPVERRTVEVWTAANAPLAYRELLQTTGQPSLEIGAAASHDPTLGTLQAVYLYQASNDTIYRTGADLPPPPQPQSQPSMSPEQSYRRLIAQPAVHSESSRLDGQPVYVIRVPGLPDQGTTIFYIDQHTYRPIMTVYHGTDLTLIKHTLVRKTLPATKANLKLTTPDQGTPRRPHPPGNTTNQSALRTSNLVRQRVTRRSVRSNRRAAPAQVTVRLGGLVCLGSLPAWLSPLPAL